jgi:hypothetical protein
MAEMEADWDLDAGVSPERGYDATVAPWVAEVVGGPI